jgi:prevent-host-death family protein
MEARTMLQVNIHEAKTQLSALVEKAARGDYFVIAKAGKPMVKVIPYTQPNAESSRVGFLRGEINIPGDFDTMDTGKIAAMFEEKMS